MNPISLALTIVGTIGILFAGAMVVTVVWWFLLLGFEDNTERDPVEFLRRRPRRAPPKP